MLIHTGVAVERRSKKSMALCVSGENGSTAGRGWRVEGFTRPSAIPRAMLRGSTAPPHSWGKEGWGWGRRDGDGDGKRGMGMGKRGMGMGEGGMGMGKEGWGWGWGKEGWGWGKEGWGWGKERL